MISVENAVKIQNVLIEKFGGTSGLRDKNLLDSALKRLTKKNYTNHL